MTVPHRVKVMVEPHYRCVDVSNGLVNFHMRPLSFHSPVHGAALSPPPSLMPLTPPWRRFDMAIQLGDLDTAHTIALSLDSAPKWKQLGELAMSSGRLEVAEKCLSNAKDFSGLMLLYAAQVGRTWWCGCKRRGRGKGHGWLEHPFI